MKKIKLRSCGGKPLLIHLLALALIVATISGSLFVSLRGTVAGPWGSAIIFNHPYNEPSPPPTAFGPDLAAWSRFRDHPGIDDVFTEARSTMYTGFASPNHIFAGSNTLMFFGYENEEHLDYIISEEYTQFTSISYELRPSQLDFNALGESGFLFNGTVTDISGQLFYSGYMIALETKNDGSSADLQLYEVADLPLSGTTADFASQGTRTLVSTYAMDITTAQTQPIYVRVESDPLTRRFQVFIDGQQRTRNLNPAGTGTSFGFVSGYAARTGAELTRVFYSNLRIEAPWVTVYANAEVFIKLDGTNTDLYDSQILTGKTAGSWGGQTGQNYYIVPPDIPGYYLVVDDLKLLDRIPYYAKAEYNKTILYYASKGSSNKEAAYHGVQNNGSLTNPVPVDVNESIDYKIHAEGDGQWRYGAWLTTSVNRQGIMSMRGLIQGYNSTGNTYFMNVPYLPYTSPDGKMTVNTNYELGLEVGEIQSSNNGFAANDGSVLAFKPTSSGGTLKDKPNALPYTTACTTAQHNIPSAWSANNFGWNQPLIRDDERYISITYNNFNNNAGYQFDYLLGTWSGGKFEDFIITFIGRNSHGEPAQVTYQGNKYAAFVNRVLGSSNNGGPAGTTPLTNNLLPAAADYTDPYDGQSYIYPDKGKIEVIFTRMHNSRHDEQIFIGAGEIAMRARETVMRVVDVLPEGTEYIPGTADYEEYLTVTMLPDGRQQLVWEFSVVPPDGYDINFQVKIAEEGTFVNEADIHYFSPAVPRTIHTNRTYHRTGQMSVIEHYFDINDPLKTPLKPARTINVPGPAGYTTSVLSMADIMTEDGRILYYQGYKRLGPDGDAGIVLGVPPNPTIPFLKEQREIELYFAENPLVTIEFRECGTGTVLKPAMTQPLTYNDPFFLPESARESIINLGLFYTYCSYSRTGSGSQPAVIHGIPSAPIYQNVTTNQTIVVYFTTEVAVTVRYVEHLNTTNVLKNNDYFVLEPPEPFNFSLTDDLFNIIYDPVTRRYFRYEGYSYPGGSFIAGRPPQADFNNLLDNQEVTLHFSNALDTEVVEQFRLLDNRATELWADNTVPILFGEDYTRGSMPPETITSGGRTYYYVGYALNGGSTVFSTVADTPETPFTNILSDGNYITYLYAVYSITEEFHRLRDEAALASDNQVDVSYDGDYERGSNPPEGFATYGPDGQSYGYVGYSINGGAMIPGPAPAKPFTGVQKDGNVITYYYEAYYVTEEFRLLDDTSVILMPNNQVSVPHGGDYERGSTPRSEIAYNGKTYIYVGYSINGGAPVMGEADAAPIKNVIAEGNVITYLYKQKAIFLHIRQVVIDPVTGLQRPAMGFYSLDNEGRTLPLTSDSLTPGFPFTDYTLIPGEDPFYILMALVPQYYEFLGHMQNGGDKALPDPDGHPVAGPLTNPPVDLSTANGSIVLDYTDTDEIWVTVYITPYGKPGDQQVSIETNQFGTVYSQPVVVTGNWYPSANGPQTVVVFDNTCGNIPGVIVESGVEYAFGDATLSGAVKISDPAAPGSSYHAEIYNIIDPGIGPWYYRAYVKNDKGQTFYGEIKQFIILL